MLNMFSNWAFPEIVRTPHVEDVPFFKIETSLDIQVNLADPLDIHLQYFGDPLDIRYPHHTNPLDILFLKISDPLDIRILKISDSLDIRYPPYGGTDNFWKSPIAYC